MKGCSEEATSSTLSKSVHSSGRRADEVLRREGPPEGAPQAPQRVHRLLHDAPRCDATLRLVQPPAPRLRQHCSYLLRLPGRLHMSKCLAVPDSPKNCGSPTVQRACHQHVLHAAHHLAPGRLRDFWEVRTQHARVRLATWVKTGLTDQHSLAAQATEIVHDRPRRAGEADKAF